jgi:hypothetical protein
MKWTYKISIIIVSFYYVDKNSINSNFRFDLGFEIETPTQVCPCVCPRRLHPKLGHYMKDVLAVDKKPRISLKIAVSTPKLGSEIFCTSFQHLN